MDEEVEEVRVDATNNVERVNVDDSESDGDIHLKFWEKFQKKDGKYSRALARLAKKYLTPPPTSTCVERLFSTASNIIDDRPRLLQENLEKLLFLRENLTKKNIDIDY